MLSELQMLLAACDATSNYDIYEAAIVDENVLLKQTGSTRKRTLRGLRELYALDREVILFHALQELWGTDPAAQPLLALLCALARDSVLRASSSAILNTAPGAPVDAGMTAAAVGAVYPGRYNAGTLGKIGRNTASSWSQSGHLQGRTQKIRMQVDPHPVVVTYALFLGYLCGARGEALLQTGWCQLLDTSVPNLHSLAQAASRLGWLDYRHIGNVTEITFSHLLRKQEETSS